MCSPLLFVHFQGRSIETNLYAQFKCDSVKMGMVSSLYLLLDSVLMTMTNHVARVKCNLRSCPSAGHAVIKQCDFEIPSWNSCESLTKLKTYIFTLVKVCGHLYSSTDTRLPWLVGALIQVKHKEVAEFLGGRLYDCVIKFTEAIP